MGQKLERGNLKGILIAIEISVLTCSFFFRKLDHRVVSDNRRFQKTVGPLFSEKAFHKESIILKNNNKTVSDNEELTEILNKHFSKLVENLGIDKTLASNIASSDITDPVFNAIKKYKCHPI